MSDEGLHEVHLNGKQLVFAFMTVTVVAVVIFLCGVMVGRGVRAPGAPVLTEDTGGVSDPTASLDTAPAVPTSGTTAGAPASAGERLTYPDRLTSEDPAPINEILKETTPAIADSSKPAAPTTAKTVAPPRTATPPRPPAASARSVPSTEPAGNGFVVQVAAVGKRAEADTITRRLAGKGYPAFVTTPGAGGPNVFRVRVGKYDSRREAESVANRLEKEEQFKPWITR